MGNTLSCLVAGLAAMTMPPFPDVAVAGNTMVAQLCYFLQRSLQRLIASA